MDTSSTKWKHRDNLKVTTPFGKPYLLIEAVLFQVGVVYRNKWRDIVNHPMTVYVLRKYLPSDAVSELLFIDSKTVTKLCKIAAQLSNRNMEFKVYAYMIFRSIDHEIEVKQSYA